MTIERTIDIPPSRRLVIEVPREVPVGQVILAFTPATSEAKALEQPRTAVSRHFGRLKNSKAFAGDPMEIQRQMRAEWDG